MKTRRSIRKINPFRKAEALLGDTIEGLVFLTEVPKICAFDVFDVHAQVTIEKKAGITVCIQRLDGGYESKTTTDSEGKFSFNDVELFEGEENGFELIVGDLDSPLLSHKIQVLQNPEAMDSGVPDVVNFVTQDVSFKLETGLIPVFREGEKIPADKIITLGTQHADQRSMKFEVLYDNHTLGEVRLDNLSPGLPEKSEILINIKIDDNLNITGSASMVKTNQTVAFSLKIPKPKLPDREKMKRKYAKLKEEFGDAIEVIHDNTTKMKNFGEGQKRMREIDSTFSNKPLDLPKLFRLIDEFGVLIVSLSKIDVLEPAWEVFENNLYEARQKAKTAESKFEKAKRANFTAALDGVERFGNQAYQDKNKETWRHANQQIKQIASQIVEILQEEETEKIKELIGNLSPEDRAKSDVSDTVEQPAVEQLAVEQPAVEQSAVEQSAVEQSAKEDLLLDVSFNEESEEEASSEDAFLEVESLEAESLEAESIEDEEAEVTVLEAEGFDEESIHKVKIPKPKLPDLEEMRQQKSEAAQESSVSDAVEQSAVEQSAKEDLLLDVSFDEESEEEASSDDASLEAESLEAESIEEEEAEGAVLEAEDFDEESIYADCFIRYTDKIVLPTIEISSESSLKEIRYGLATMNILNTSDFTYSVSIRRAPDWLVVQQKEIPLLSGEMTHFEFGVDPANLPPGAAVGTCELVMKGPFLKQSYPFQAVIETKYTSPAPQIEVKATIQGGVHTLTVDVRNAGGGLLQGYCYDRTVNRHHSFLLASKTLALGAERRESVGGEGYVRKDEHSFHLERSFDDPSKIANGLLIGCDCINERLRNFEITPQSLLKKENFTYPPFIDFMGVEPGRRHEFEIAIRDPSFHFNTAVNVPARLKEHLKYEFKPRGKILFSLSEKAHRLGCVVDYVGLKTSRGKSREILVMVSFSHQIGALSRSTRNE